MQMWIRNFRRFIAEAFSGMIKNGLMTVASVVVVTSCLILLGIFLIVTLNVNSISENIADACEIKVYITDEAKYCGKIQSISNEIKSLDHLEAITFENGEKSFKEIKKGMNDEELALFEGLPDNLMNDSFNITVDDISNTRKISEKIKQIDGVKSVENSEKVVTFINSVRKGVKHFSFWTILAFMLISIFIISNTVKLTVHNRRKEINIMKYVGATDSYIRWPFIIEGILVGLISAIIAFVLTNSVYSAIYNAVSHDSSLIKFIELLRFKDIWDVFAISYAGLGAVIGAMGSAFSIRKYLKV